MFGTFFCNVSFEGMAIATFFVVHLCNWCRADNETETFLVEVPAVTRYDTIGAQGAHECGGSNDSQSAELERVYDEEGWTRPAVGGLGEGDAASAGMNGLKCLTAGIWRFRRGDGTGDAGWAAARTVCREFCVLAAVVALFRGVEREFFLQDRVVHQHVEIGNLEAFKAMTVAGIRPELCDESNMVCESDWSNDLIWYTTAKPDGFGSQIHDMLIAYAFTSARLRSFHSNMTNTTHRQYAGGYR